MRKNWIQNKNRLKNHYFGVGENESYSRYKKSCRDGWTERQRRARDGERQAQLTQ